MGVGIELEFRLWFALQAREDAEFEPPRGCPLPHNMVAGVGEGHGAEPPSELPWSPNPASHTPRAQRTPLALEIKAESGLTYVRNSTLLSLVVSGFLEPTLHQETAPWPVCPVYFGKTL